MQKAARFCTNGRLVPSAAHFKGAGTSSTAIMQLHAVSASRRDVSVRFKMGEVRCVAGRHHITTCATLGSFIDASTVINVT